jgi:hypothetical protein
MPAILFAPAMQILEPCSAVQYSAFQPTVSGASIMDSNQRRARLRSSLLRRPAAVRRRPGKGPQVLRHQFRGISSDPQF